MNRQLEPKERLIFPLDVPSWAEAAPLVESLAPEVGWFKIGLELFVAEGPSVVARVKDAAPGNRIFLDLKLHDIPATVGRAMKAASTLGADLVTVHAQGGPAMLMAAAQQAGSRTKVLAITVLTSLNPKEFTELTPECRDSRKWAVILARRAQSAGCHGLVASGEEVKTLRAELGPDFWLVVPGIRPAWSLVAGDDQARVSTPASALKDGADLIVVGRPIRDADNPAAAAARVTAEIARV